MVLVKNHTYKVVNRYMGKALHQYDMISDGDRILVALSGGKDSLTLMWMLYDRLKRIPIKYELFPVHIDPGFDDNVYGPLEAHCREHDIPLRVEITDYGVKAHSSKNRENPCFLCSWQRRKRLFEIADELKCNKLAFGHNKDDLIETLFINMCYSGEISTMMPSQVFFKGLFTLIRPLSYVDEKFTRKFSAEQGFPELVNSCPSASGSKRKEIKTLLETLYKSNKKIKGNIFRAMKRVNPDYLLK